MPVMIEIATQKVITRSGRSQRTGNNYSMREQEAFLHKPGQPYPDKIKITLGDDQPPYTNGNYDLEPDSFFPNKYGALDVRPILKPRAAEQQRSPVSKAS